MATVAHGDFEWDDAKAEANVRKHGVSFDEAATTFEDPNHLVVDDGSGGGETYWLIGFSIAGRSLTVVHCERGSRERIISAWRATAEDERRYRQERDAPGPGRRTRAERGRALAEVVGTRIDTLRSLGFVIPGEDASPWSSSRALATAGAVRAHVRTGRRHADSRRRSDGAGSTERERKDVRGDQP